MGMGGDGKIAVRAVITAAPEFVLARLDIAQESDARLGEEMGPPCRSRLDRGVSPIAAFGDGGEEAAAKIRRGRRPPAARADKAAGGREERCGPALPVRGIQQNRKGVIGVALPMEKIRAALPGAFGSLANDQGAAAARAIMTTDPFPKEASADVQIGGGTIRIGGMAKGSGMIEPMMATMLAFVTTDASVPQPLLARALRHAVDDSFNAITVDGECSTNDCVMLLANGASGLEIDDSNYPAFVQGLHAVCRELALGIVRGGEGATKLVTVNVTGAASSEEARRAAKAIANSLLVKTAIHGGDPNWGRLIAVAGRANVAFDLSKAGVMIGRRDLLFKNDRPHDGRRRSRRTSRERRSPWPSTSALAVSRPSDVLI